MEDKKKSKEIKTAVPKTTAAKPSTAKTAVAVKSPATAKTATAKTTTATKATANKPVTTKVDKIVSVPKATATKPSAATPVVKPAAAKPVVKATTAKPAVKASKGATGKLKITLRKSIIGGSPKQRKTMQALGLKKIGTSVIKNDLPSTQGMIVIVRHLVEVESI